LRGSRFRSRRLVSVFPILVLVVLVTLGMGQVLGNYYLKNITRDGKLDFSSGPQESLPPANGKRKVLRLEKLDYYTLQLAVYDSREEAFSLGYELAKKGLPVVITAGSPSKIVMGFVNKKEGLDGLSSTLVAKGFDPVLVKGQVNSVAFKFEADDSFASERIAPFLGDITFCLEKALLLYESTDSREERTFAFRDRYSLLAEELEEAGKRGLVIGKEVSRKDYSLGIQRVAERCLLWAESLRQAEESWGDLPLLISQQQAQALVDEYHLFIALSNQEKNNAI
jgi:hypothetical protein